MNTRTKVILGGIGTALLVAFAGSVALASVDVREIGRTDPKRAANFRPPWFNFSENYSDGEVLGIPIGSTRGNAISVAERAGFVVETSGWGDNRAGQADLYDRATLLATMERQPHLNFHDASDLHRGMTVRFSGDRVRSISVHYTNFEGP